MGRKCASNCAKAKERYRQAIEAENANFNASSSQSFVTSDIDFDLSDNATDYQSLPGRSAPTSRESGRHNIYVEQPMPERKRCDLNYDRSHRHSDAIYARHDDTDEPDETDKSARTARYSFGSPHHKIPKTTPKRQVNYRHSPRQANRQQSKHYDNDDCISSNRTGSQRHDTAESETFYDDTELSSDTDRSLSCPALCEKDPARLPSPKSRCEDSCSKQLRLDATREKRQEAADKYVLTSGFRYFDNLCCCSLKCLIIELGRDPFIKKTMASAAFFFIGMKLCFELDAWYLII